MVISYLFPSQKTSLCLSLTTLHTASFLGIQLKLCHKLIFSSPSRQICHDQVWYWCPRTILQEWQFSTITQPFCPSPVAWKPRIPMWEKLHGWFIIPWVKLKRTQEGAVGPLQADVAVPEFSIMGRYPILHNIIAYAGKVWLSRDEVSSRCLQIQIW